MDRVAADIPRQLGPRELIAAAARRQRGIVARWQLLARGVPEHVIDDAVRSGLLLVLHPGVYALGHRSLRREAIWHAGALACGPRALVSHISGAAVRGLLLDNGANVHVTVPGRTTRREGLIVHRSRTLAPQDATVHDGIPVTSVARTLLDVAATHQTLLPRAIDQAERLKVFDLRDVIEVVGRNRGHRGAARLVAAVEDFSPGSAMSDSVLADTFLELVLAAGLARPECEVYVLDYRVDFLWRAEKVVVEADGWGSHRTHRAFQDDRTRDRDLQFAGYVVLRVTRRDVLSGAHDVLQGLAALLAERGPSRRG